MYIYTRTSMSVPPTSLFYFRRASTWLIFLFRARLFYIRTPTLSYFLF